MILGLCWSAGGSACLLIPRWPTAPMITTRTGPQEEPQEEPQGPADSSWAARPPAGARHTSSRRRTPPGASRAEPAPLARPRPPPAHTTGQPPGQRHLPGHGRTSKHSAGSDPRSCPGPPTSSTRPGCPAASPLRSSSPPALQPAAASRAASAPAGHPTTAASTSSAISRHPVRSAAANCSRSPATTVSSAAIPPPAPRSPALGPGSAHHADPRAAPPAAHRTQPEIIPETTLSHHGNTRPDAET